LLRAIDFIAGGATHRLVAASPEPETPSTIAHSAAAPTGKPMAAI
jgi:hypothetical protein